MPTAASSPSRFSNPDTYEPPQVMLRSEDTGLIGMDSEVQSHLFEPFYTTKGREKGTAWGFPSYTGREQAGGTSPSILINEGQRFNLPQKVRF